MEVLKGFEPIKTPHYKGKSKALIEAFITTGERAMGKRCSIKERDRMYNTLRLYLHRHPEYDVKVARDGDTLLLIRGVGE